MSPDDVIGQWLDELPIYAEDQLQILDKSNRLVPLRLNRVQLDFHARLEAQLAELGRVRCVVLKARQLGLSTYLAARMFHAAHLRPQGARCYVLAHDDDTAKKLALMSRTMYTQLDPSMRRGMTKSNDHELALTNGAFLEYHTAGKGTRGRGGTVSHYHSSEVGFQEKAALHMAASLQQLGKREETEAYFESTANGPIGAFYEIWREAKRGENDFLPVFYPWFWDPEYSSPAPAGFGLSHEAPNDIVLSEHEYAERHGLDDAQMYWRRMKIGELGMAGLDGALVFAQEYPATDEEAFGGTSLDSFISPQHVEQALKRPVMPEMMRLPLVLGCDPAPAHGGSSTAVVWRRGTAAYQIARWNGLGVEEQANRLYEIFIADGASRLGIDTSEGTGQAIFELLRARAGLAGRVFPVVFGSKPNDRSRYRNKRAEMWATMGLWLARQVHLATELALPGQATLAAELVSVRRKEGDERLITLESKDEMRRRGIASPDGADALAITFAWPDPDESHAGFHVATMPGEAAWQRPPDRLRSAPDDYHVAPMGLEL